MDKNGQKWIKMAKNGHTKERKRSNITRELSTGYTKKKNRACKKNLRRQSEKIYAKLINRPAPGGPSHEL